MNQTPKSLEEILNSPRKNLNNTQLLKRQRYRLWLKDPLCFWCKQPTIFIENIHLNKKNKSPLNMATIDHLRSRYNPNRNIHNKGTEIRRVLSCWKCNNERAREEEKTLPIEILWAKSGRFPKEKVNILI